MPRKRQRPHTYLSHEQVSDLALAAGDLGPLVLVLAYCGLRWGEASGLRVGTWTSNVAGCTCGRTPSWSAAS